MIDSQKIAYNKQGLTIFFFVQNPGFSGSIKNDDILVKYNFLQF